MTDIFPLTLTRDEIELVLKWSAFSDEEYGLEESECELTNRLLAIVDPECGMERDTDFLETPTRDQQTMRAWK